MLNGRKIKNELSSSTLVVLDSGSMIWKKFFAQNLNELKKH